MPLAREKALAQAAGGVRCGLVSRKAPSRRLRLLNREVLPLWERRKAYDIMRRDVIALLDGLVDRGTPSQANKVLALIRKLFNWAISRGLRACLLERLGGCQ
jgi:hypothetical protein